MKSSELKSLIKEATREVFHEEIKELLFEALKSQKTVISESPKSTLPPESRRAIYENILQETHKSFTTQDVGKFDPTGVDSINGSLPMGEVGMDQILNFIKPK